MKTVLTSVIVAVLVSLALLTGVKAQEKKKVVCYYGSWAVYRYGPGKFDVENIDPFLCTHLIFTFAGLDERTNRIVSLDPYNDLYDNWGRGAYERFVNLKRRNPEVKVILAIGGWNEGSEKYSAMVSDPSSRQVFTESVVEMLLRYRFDGFDFDWEYPANRGGAPGDKENFIAMSTELKAAFQPHGLLLTVAVSCGKFTIDTAYNVPAMNQIYDQIHLMCYDLHGAWEPFTGHNSPLYGNPDIDTGNNSYLNVDWAVNYWLALGATPSRLILGMPLYGRGFTLDDPNSNGLYATANQPIDAGPYTGEVGFWGYYEILEKLGQGGWTVVRDPHYMVPYAYKNRQWIGYDDEQSLTLKTYYLLSKGLGGAMLWSIETDDFSARFHEETYVLTRTIYMLLNGVPPTPGPSLPPIETTTPVVPTPPSGICTEDGYVRDPFDCAVFYQCVSNGQGGWTTYAFRCSEGTVFNPESNSCAFPDQVPGCEDYPNRR